MSHTDSLLVYALVSVIFLMDIKAKAKWHPFIALLLASVILGIIAGMDNQDVADAVQIGVGNTLG
ncbi:H+/gluconate symporter-like permease [Peribacillus sp. V2I11]|nr:H+/gluconate symporter-like permease [Peribacillus sp. V2I11]